MHRKDGSRIAKAGERLTANRNEIAAVYFGDQVERFLRVFDRAGYPVVAGAWAKIAG